MARYRKKPVVIDATQWFPGQEIKGVYNWWAATGAHVVTLEGPLDVSEGDWIITGVKGEIYPCKPDIFEETYEPLIEEEQDDG